LQREIYDWRRRSRKCQSKTFVENNTENLKMMWS
jgi:hypothetical protein